MLPARYSLVIEFADVLIGDPRSMTPELSAALQAEFEPDQLRELALTITMAAGFSKAAVAWGPAPVIPVMEVPTPTPGGSVA